MREVPKFKCINCENICLVYDLSFDGFCEDCHNG